MVKKKKKLRYVKYCHGMTSFGFFSFQISVYGALVEWYSIFIYYLSVVTFILFFLAYSKPKTQ